MRVILALLLAVSAAAVPLASFDGAKATTFDWVTVNDPVMGGQSTSTFKVANKMGLWQGEVKVVPFLHAPGFCTLRTQGSNKFADATGTTSMSIQLVNKGGPGHLKSFELQVETTGATAARQGATYSAKFNLTGTLSEENPSVAWSDFKLTWRGRKIDGPAMASQLGKITRVGLGSSGVAGPFNLQIGSISAGKAAVPEHENSMPASIALLLAGVPLAQAACSDCIPLVSFDSSAPKAVTHTWKAMNDPVMGGRSTSTVAVQNNVLNFTGVCAIVPKLKAPGFITAVAGGGFFRSDKFVDVSKCTGLVVEAKDFTAGYQGYRISFGKAKPPGGKFFARGYKADLHPTVGDFGSVQIPFSSFTDFWDDATGNPIHTCAEKQLYCPDAATLADMKTMSIWAEGVEGAIHLEVRSISGYGCGSGQYIARQATAGGTLRQGLASAAMAGLSSLTEGSSIKKWFLNGD